jgi:hypothetical protein
MHSDFNVAPHKNVPFMEDSCTLLYETTELLFVTSIPANNFQLPNFTMKFWAAAVGMALCTASVQSIGTDIPDCAVCLR